LSGSPVEFASEVWAVLDAYGEVKQNKPATVAFLEELRQTVGIDQQEKINYLMDAIQKHHAGNIFTPPPEAKDSREDWLLKTVYQIGMNQAVQNERWGRTCEAVDRLDALTQTVDRVDRRTEQIAADTARNQRGIWFNRVFFFTFALFEFAIIVGMVLALSGAT
jgi:hypothetical protein